MIGMRVGKQHRIQAPQPNRQRLLAQIRPSVEQQIQPGHLEQR
jgi:hypothetical protein